MAKTRRMASICGVLQCVAVCCNIFTRAFARLMAKTRKTASICSVLQCVAVCCKIFTFTLARSTEMHERVASGVSYGVCVCTVCVCVCVREIHKHSHTHTQGTHSRTHIFYIRLCVYIFTCTFAGSTEIHERVASGAS